MTAQKTGEFGVYFIQSDQNIRTFPQGNVSKQMCRKYTERRFNLAFAFGTYHNIKIYICIA